MAKKLLFIPILTLFLVIISLEARGDVLIEDVNISGDVDDGITSGLIDSGSGEPGDYELIVCGIDTDDPNPFNLPSPGSWNEINNSTCFQPNCQFGLWGRSTNSPSSEEITCSWNDDSQAFVAGSIRYKNVDTNNPIIDSACSEFIDGLYVIPPVSSEPGAQLVTFFLTRVRSGGLPPTGVAFDEFNALFTEAVEFNNDGNIVITLQGTSKFDENGEGFSGEEFPPFTDIFAAKFCVVTLRMATPPTIPTMSEWGLITMAAILGIVGFMVIRRKKASA